MVAKSLIQVMVSDLEERVLHTLSLFLVLFSNK
nr:MAG TPA: hypothetical protein [Caudoviricetes sp.]